MIISTTPGNDDGAVASAAQSALPTITTKPPLGCALLMIDLFRKYLHNHHLPLTHQRETIALTLFQSDGHLSVDDLADLLHNCGERVGKATIYRTLKLVVEAGLARELDFGEGFKRYEHQAGQEGFDHLVCTECGRVERFRRPTIEQLQEEIAEEAGFRVQKRRLEIYGTCAECQTGLRPGVEGEGVLTAVAGPGSAAPGKS